MLQEKSLATLFKCMDATCNFSSCGAGAFTSHLKCHEEKTQGSLQCAYCKFTAKNDSQLISHIIEDHTYDMFSCVLCFYRCASLVNIATHYKAYHSDSPVEAIECILSKPMNDALAFQNIETEANLTRHVPKMHCPCCSESFYIWDAYLQHLNAHPESEKVRPTCQKCQKSDSFKAMPSHFQSCYRISMFQCLYCRYGIDSVEHIELHLANSHATKLPVYCSRKGNGKVTQKKGSWSCFQSKSIFRTIQRR